MYKIQLDKNDIVIDVDKFSHHLVKELWIALGESYKLPFMVYFKRKIENDDLSSLIDAAVATSKALINATSYPDDIFGAMAQRYVVDLESCRKFLEFLRFPKRYTPGHNDLGGAAVKKFFDNNNRVKMVSRHTYPQFIIGRLRTFLDDVLPPAPTISYTFTRAMSLPTGQSFDHDRRTSEKVRELLEAFPFFFGTSFRTSNSSLGIRYVNELTTVPKSYNSSRVIAMEETSRQTIMSEGAILLDKVISGIGTLDIHNQSPNQELAQEGSVTGELATIDLSAASDSISMSLVREVFPPSWSNYIDQLRATCTMYNGRRHTLHMVSTMGSRLTFPIETLLFYAIACIAADIQSNFDGIDRDTSKIRSYGDDIITYSDCYPITCEILDVLGFIVNDDKSYTGESPYRESCGREYYAGYDISSRYYPRKPLSASKGVLLTQLLALQHKFVEVDEVNDIICQYILQLDPDMTFSRPYSDNMDIWSYFDTIRYVDEPYADDSHHMVEYHKKPVTMYTGSDDAYSQIAAYVAFLKDGPSYPDDLCKLLGVTAKVDPRQYNQEGRIVYK